MQFNYDLGEYVIIIAIAGAFGGCVSALFDNLMAVHKSFPVHGCSKCKTWYFACRSLIGVAGAFGVVLIGGWVGKVKLGLDTNTLLELISLCVISGTVSYRLLPVIGARLEKQITALENKSTEQSMTIEKLKSNDEHTRQELKNNIILQDALALAKDALSIKEVNSFSDIHTAISIMETFSDTAKYNRTYNIYLARLHRKVKNYNRAIEVLRGYLQSLNDPELPAELKSTAKTNKAAALYNIACYHVLKAFDAKDTSSGPELDRLIEEALSELEQSIMLDPSNIACVSSDSEVDFSYVKQSDKWNPRLLALIS